MKHFITIFCLLFISSLAHSQVFEGGFFFGMTASQVDGDTYGGFNKMGLNAGGYITKEISRRANWKAEIRYVQKGAYNGPTNENPSLYKLLIHYVEIPLMYQYHINDKVIVDAGISPDIYLYHKEEDEYEIKDPDDGPAYHRLGLNGNIGVYYSLTDRLIAGARQSYSLIPMRDHASGQTYLLNRGQYNNVISFTFYYHFE